MGEASGAGARTPSELRNAVGVGGRARDFLPILGFLKSVVWWRRGFPMYPRRPVRILNHQAPEGLTESSSMFFFFPGD